MNDPAPIAPRHVVLVHGIWDTFHTMQKLERTLCTAGFEALAVNLTPNNGRASLDDLGAQVHQQIEGWLPNGARFSIVGFSMGGLVARSYLRQFGDSDRLAAFVSIASPHAGTWLAWLHGGAGARDMRRGSAFLAAIDADASRFAATRWTTIRTPLDLMILPSSSSMLRWAKNHSLFVLAHPLLVRSRRVGALVVQALQASPISTT